LPAFSDPVRIQT